MICRFEQHVTLAIDPRSVQVNDFIGGNLDTSGHVRISSPDYILLNAEGVCGDLCAIGRVGDESNDVRPVKNRRVPSGVRRNDRFIRVERKGPADGVIDGYESWRQEE